MRDREAEASNLYVKSACRTACSYPDHTDEMSDAVRQICKALAARERVFRGFDRSIRLDLLSSHTGVSMALSYVISAQGELSLDSAGLSWLVRPAWHDMGGAMCCR